MESRATIAAGWAAVDITPPLGVPLSGYFVSEGRGACADDVLDPLLAKAVVLASGPVSAALVTTDLIHIPDDLLRRTREAIVAATGIAASHIVISATHNHSGPTLGPLPQGPNLYPGETHRAYVDVLVDRLCSAVRMAQRRLAPCRLGAGVGTSTINVNRRERRPDGTFMPLPFLGQHRDGPVDRSVTVIRFDNGSGETLLLINYACHAVVLGPNLEISADFPGATQRFVEHAYGGRVLAMFTNGAQGDINPVIHPGSHDDAERLGRALAGEVIRVAEGIEVTPSTQLTAGRRRLTLPIRRNPTLEDEAVALERLLAVARTERVRRPLPEIIQEEMDYSIEMMRHLKRVAHPGGVPIEILALRIGDVGLCTIPGELFTELGQEIKAASPFPTTVLLGLANGAAGYMPTRRAYDEGGFEVQATALEAGAAETFREEARSLLAELWQATARPAAGEVTGQEGGVGRGAGALR
jgi:neutral ceramidase